LHAALRDVVFCSTLDELVDSIVTSIQEQRKTSNEYVAIVKSKPRMAATQAPTALANMATNYLRAEREHSRLGAELKELNTEAKTNLEHPSSCVGDFLRRGSLSSQRVNLKRKLSGGGAVQESVFIRRKISRRKPRLTLPILTDVVFSTVEKYASRLRSHDEFVSLEHSLVEAILEELDAIPSVETERISLTAK
jgi:hypothetical protein